MSTSNAVRLGRAADNDIVIAHPSISAHHAELHFDGEQFLLRDLSSSNGTFVNGERVTSAVLNAGDIVHLGPVALEFRDGQLQMRVDYDSEPDGEPAKTRTKARPALLLALLAGIAAAALFFVTNSSEDPEPEAATRPATSIAVTTTTLALTTTTEATATTAATTTLDEPTTTVPPTTTIPPTTTMTAAEIASQAILTAPYEWGYSEETKDLQAQLTLLVDGYYGLNTLIAHRAALAGLGLTTAGVPNPPPTTTQTPTTTVAPTTTVPPTTTISAAEIASQAILTAPYEWGYSEETKDLQAQLTLPVDGYYGLNTLIAHRAALAGLGLTTAGVPNPPPTTTQTPTTTVAPTTTVPATTTQAPTTTVTPTAVAVIDLYSQPPDLEDKIATAIAASVGIDCVSGFWGSSGSGWPLQVAGASTTYVVTNHHVIEDCIGTGYVTLEIGDKTASGVIVNWDATYDLAIIETTLSLSPLPTAGWPKIGHWVMAVGNPLGIMGSVNMGHVSNLDGSDIVHDAAINSGNSGGPLINAEGQVVGVNYAHYADTNVMSLAVGLRMLCVELLVCDDQQWK